MHDQDEPAFFNLFKVTIVNPYSYGVIVMMCKFAQFQGSSFITRKLFSEFKDTTDFKTREVVNLVYKDML